MSTKAQKKSAAKKSDKRAARRDDPKQSRRFIEAAKEAEADEGDAGAADEVMGRMAEKPPKHHKKEKPDQ